MTSKVIYIRISYINNKKVNMQVVWVINIKIRKNNYIIFRIVIFMLLPMTSPLELKSFVYLIDFLICKILFLVSTSCQLKANISPSRIPRGNPK